MISRWHITDVSETTATVGKIPHWVCFGMAYILSIVCFIGRLVLWHNVCFVFSFSSYASHLEEEFFELSAKSKYHMTFACTVALCQVHPQFNSNYSLPLGLSILGLLCLCHCYYTREMV